MRAGSSLCDQGSGMWAVIGALSLLQRRHVTGQGGVVSTSLLEAAMVWNGQKTDALNNEDRLPERHRSGHPGFVPYEAFQAADGPLLICCGNDRLFSKLAEELGRLDWLADERFKTNRDRLQNKSALLEQLSDHLRDKTRAYWLEKFEAAGVPCAPIHSLPEAIAHPQVQALGIIQTVPGENFKLTGLPLVIDGHRPQLKGPAPKLGQHNSDLLSTHGFERPQSSQ
jgi:formyl-CoA transferase